MIQRLAVDTNAVVGWLRSGTDTPPLRGAATIIVPLPVLGELYAGAYSSHRRDENLRAIHRVRGRHPILVPDDDTARIYGETRARHHLQNVGPRKMNDLWIAALCIQHSLPLLTNDRGFDPIAGLTVIHW